MKELQAELGILQRKYIEAEKYRQGLSGIKGICFLPDFSDIKHNYKYYPILINEQLNSNSRDEVYE